MDFVKRDRDSMLAVKIGLIANILLAVLKTLGGVLGHSPALLADGINSTSDVAYYLVVWLFMRLAGKPPDHEHPYGHRQLESIAALIVGAFVITTAVAVFWNSIYSLYDLLIGESDFGGATTLALWIALFTIFLKIALTFYTRRIGERTRNSAISALAYDHRNDLFAATAAAVGIILGRNGFPWVDPLAGALVALFIFMTGVKILRESSADLMDTIPGKELAERVKSVLIPIPGIQDIEEIHAHRFGPYLIINVTIGVDGDISVADGDAIACQVEESLYSEMELLRWVHVHYHPADRNMEYDRAEGNHLMPEEFSNL
ncbi:MAG: cation diffusion facilitator family transporter [Candidatus Promineifilaceae bacterium]|jgi:cation diffusion facilitator family transporter